MDVKRNRKLVRSLCLAKLVVFSCAPISAAPVDLKCDYRVNPLAVEADAVRFFWKNDADHQKAYQLLVSTDEALAGNSLVWDSGVQTTSKSIQIAYAGAALQPATRYFWKVGVLNQDGEWSWSKGSHFFETVIDPETGWNGASWISCDRNHRAHQMAPKGWLGEWISSAKDTNEGLKYSFVLPKNTKYVFGGCYYALKYGRPTAILVNGKACAYPSGNVIGSTDFGFLLRPGVNRIEVDFKGAPADQSIAFGMKIIDVDGNVKWVRSNKDWKISSGGDCRLRPERANQPQRVHFASKLAPAWYKKSLSLNREIAEARIYYAGVGYAEAYINGTEISDHGMETGQSDYEAFAYYQTKDVTELVKNGSNTLSFLVADGWYNQDRGFCTAAYSYGKPALIANFVVTYKDGTQAILTTDKSWKWATGAIQYSNIYLGEEVDFRKERSDPFSPEFSSDWKAVTVREPVSPVLKAQDFEPVRKIREVEAVQSWQAGRKTWIYDFGRNLAGGVKVTFNEPAGTEIRIRVTEAFNEDTEQLENVPESFWWCHAAPQNHLIIADGNEHTWEPKFTYHAFQFLEISGLSSKPEIVATDVYSDVEQTGFFTSSDPLINKIYDMGVRTHYMNMHSILEDCPHREKCLWGGDLHASWATGYFSLDSAAFYRQQARVYFTGNMFAPGVPGNVGVGKRATQNLLDFSWCVSPFFVAYRNYQIYGDLSTFANHYEVILRSLKTYEENSQNLIPNRAVLGDHAEPEEIKRPPQNAKLIAAINFYAACLRFSEMAEALGKTKDVEYAKDLAEKTKASVNERFLNRKTNTYGNATHDSLALSMGIVPEDASEGVQNSLRAYYKKNQKRFDGGFMSYNIYPWLSKLGESELAYEMLTSPHYQGLAWSIKYHNATSFWEFYGHYSDRWKQLILPDRSRAHHAMNHPAAWLLNHVAGIQHDETAEPGMQSFILAPKFLDALHHAEGSCETLYGTIRSRWERKEDGEIVWDFTIPPNCKANVIDPSGVKTYSSGSYSINIPR